MITSLIRQHPRLSLAIGALLLLLLLAVALGIFALSRVYAQPPQPLPFKHSVHVAAGAQCLYCHPGATSGPVAGLPSTAKCMGCHQNVQPADPADQEDVNLLLQAWENKEPIQWVKINDQPDFVQFNHRPHVAAGVACESCHGDVANQDYAVRYNHNMGWCLSCHHQQAPEKQAKLIDCATCHY